MLSRQNQFIAENMLSFPDEKIQLLCWGSRQSIITFYNLSWNRDKLEPEQENTEDNSGLVVGEDATRTLAATGSPEWTELQTSPAVVCVGCESVRIEPAEGETRPNSLYRILFTFLIQRSKLITL